MAGDTRPVKDCHSEDKNWNIANNVRSNTTVTQHEEEGTVRR